MSQIYRDTDRHEDPKGKYGPPKKGRLTAVNGGKSENKQPAAVGEAKLEAAGLLIDALKKEQIEAVPAVGGSWCGWTLLKPEVVKVEGLEKPFYVNKELHPATDVDRVRAAVVQVPQQKDPTVNVWATTFIEQLLTNQEGETTLAKMNRPQVGHAEQRATHSWNGSQNGLVGDKVVPQRDWFPPSVRSLKLEELLGFFPVNEARAFGLFLGRVLAGSRTDKTVEGIEIEHFYRQLTVVSGPPGIGKSYFWSVIEEALSILGYCTDPWDIQNPKFGLIPTVSSDVAVQGDVRDLDHVLAFPRLKHMITGGTDKLESKGISHRVVTLRAAFLCFTNVVDLKEMEPGILDRLTILHTKNTHELRQSGTRPRELWQALAKASGVSTQVLALWLLRLSFELFLDQCGYVLDSNGYVTGDKGADMLEDYTLQLKKGLSVEYGASHVASLVESVGKLLSVHLVNLPPEAQVKLVEKAKMVGFSLQILYPLLALVTTTKDWREPGLSFFAPDLDMTSTAALENALQSYKQRVSGMPPAKAFEFYTEHLSSRSGMLFPTSRYPYNLKWQDYLSGIDQWLPSIQERCNKGIPPQIKKLSEDLGAEIDRLSMLVPAH